MIARLSGIVGYEPTGTLRELFLAAESRQRSEWDRTSELLALQLNLAARKHIVSAHQLNPYHDSYLKSQLPTLDDLEDFLEPQ